MSFADFVDGLAAYDAGDLQAAYDEWLPLAQAGDLQAQVALAGLLQVGGFGLARNFPEAVAWYRRAAERGDPVAQMNLGDLYAKGQGVKRDAVRAFAWLSLAAEQGRDWAARQRDALAETMTPEETAEAKALMVQLRAAY
ncbi:sel1 repeat family protein [Pelagibius litoralis]|uniref:Sel1 repeat family protein n=1 Tax=Pelagibius litoralis TaxID=374515 RepID=A0A967EV35_9PROT|nr:tetratricopeptide repeat protein [Pelagibius litoralis]NIA67234.1 sel1 repeat family protein [Pelagibius litoralis]